MASRSRLVVTVTKSSSQSTITIRSLGKYASLITNSLSLIEYEPSLMPTATEQAFWAAVLAVVGPAIAAT